MAHVRLKLCVVLLGICWSLLLVYVMSSLKWQPGDLNSAQHIPQAGEKANIPMARAAKSQMLIKEILDAIKLSNNKTKSINTTTLKDLVVPAKRNETKKSESAINVVISGDEETLLGVMAVINSVVANTKSPVHFYITLPKIVIPDFRKWIMKTKLHKIKYTIRPHSPEMPKGKPHFAKIYLFSIFPELEGKFVYLDSDVIVQGNIKELNNVPLDENHLGAFSEDCTSMSKRFNMAKPRYSTHINLQHPKLKGNKIKPMACTFNTNVFVANMTKWKAENVTMQLLDWVMSSSRRQPIYGQEPETDEAEAAMLIVLYHKTVQLPHLWHVGDLGVTAGASYSRDFIATAKLLHWNGHFKPWARRAAFIEMWMKYYIPDPDKKYKPIRKYL
ncbi:glycosyltransferase 8 domain-containing protein 1 [Penaeus vannamei]|uniref:glycosyltransferase 8 domain-containing protein 1 n=1 Tax=Penaeus vannamei TaxID=6689 RepID=UPI00387FABEA